MEIKVSTVKQTEITLKKLDEIKPYDKNPRNNEAAVQLVSNSIREFGFKVPIVIDKDGVIVCGHTRYKAAHLLGLDEVPCIVADDLTPAQVKAYRLADNKVAEASQWDFENLADEMAGLADFDMTDFGFAELGDIEVEPYGDTSTDRDGQGVTSTWESCKKTGAAPVRIGPMESRITVETAQRIVEKCNRAFSENGTPINETLEAIMLCALQS